MNSHEGSQCKEQYCKTSVSIKNGYTVYWTIVKDSKVNLKKLAYVDNFKNDYFKINQLIGRTIQRF